ncbi:hypothetical protein GQ457_04G015800 [Hibiscus cannabinus]
MFILQIPLQQMLSSPNLQNSIEVQFLVQFQGYSAIAARNSLQGRNIYGGYCQLDIQLYDEVGLTDFVEPTQILDSCMAATEMDSGETQPFDEMPTTEVIDIDEISEGLEDMDAKLPVQFEDGPSATIIDFSKVLCPSILSKPIFEIVSTSFFEDHKASFQRKGQEDTCMVMVDNADNFQLVINVLDDRYQFRSVEFVHIENTTKVPFLRRMYSGVKFERAYSKMFMNANKLIAMNDPYGFRLLVMGSNSMVVDNTTYFIELSITLERTVKIRASHVNSQKPNGCFEGSKIQVFWNGSTGLWNYKGLSELRAHKTLQTIREQFFQSYGKHYQIRVQVEYDHLFLCSIQGVVVFGVEGELVSLTESFTKVIDVIFAAGWLNKKKVIASQKLSVSISHDSRIFAPQLHRASREGETRQKLWAMAVNLQVWGKMCIQRYSRTRQEEVQATKFSKGQAQMQELKANMEILDKEVAAALIVVEAQQESFNLQGLVAIVEREKSYHLKVDVIANEIEDDVQLLPKRLSCYGSSIDFVGLNGSITTSLLVVAVRKRAMGNVWSNHLKKSEANPMLFKTVSLMILGWLSFHLILEDKDYFEGEVL